MVDVGGNAVAILKIFAEIRHVVEEVQPLPQQVREVRGLSDGVAAVEPFVRCRQKGMPSKVLDELFETLKKIKIFLIEYKGMTTLTRAFRRKIISAKFEELKKELNAWVQAVQVLDIPADDWDSAETIRALGEHERKVIHLCCARTTHH